MQRFILCAAVSIVMATTSANAEVITTLDIGHDAAPGTAEAIYNAATGELIFDVGENVGVIAFGNLDYSTIMYPEKVDTGSIFGHPLQNNHYSVAYLNLRGLPVGEDSVGFVVHSGLKQEDMFFSYTPFGCREVPTPVTIIPEPSTFGLLFIAVAGLLFHFHRRRKV